MSNVRTRRVGLFVSALFAAGTLVGGCGSLGQINPPAEQVENIFQQCKNGGYPYCLLMRATVGGDPNQQFGITRQLILVERHDLINGCKAAPVTINAMKESDFFPQISFISNITIDPACPQADTWAITMSATLNDGREVFGLAIKTGVTPNERNTVDITLE